MVFRLSCTCLRSQKSKRESRAVLSGATKINRTKMKRQVQICFQVILWLSFEQVCQGNTPTQMDLSWKHADLMFEILLSGVELDQDNNIVLLDKELASMRSGRSFLSNINDNIPRSRSSTVQLVTTLGGERRQPLTQAQFEELVLSMVHAAYQARHQAEEEEQLAWGGMLLQLANVTVHELRGSHLFTYA